MSRARWTDLFSEVRKPDLSCASLEQHAAQSFLHFLDLHRQSRLRDRTRFCRASEVAMTGQRIEVAKLLECDMIHKNILLYQSQKSISPDGLRCVEARHRVETMHTTTGRQ